MSLSKKQREEAIDYVKDQLPPEFFMALRVAYDDRPKDWWAENGWYSETGTKVRNLLREIISDDELPEGTTWDDHYIEVLERATGIEYPIMTIKNN